MRPRSIFSRDLLARTIAHGIQEQALGKLSRETRKLLDRMAKGDGEPVRHLKIGTVLVREHQGTLHQVIVVPGGFSWQEKTYPSLSTIARHHWHIVERASLFRLARREQQGRHRRA